MGRCAQARRGAISPATSHALTVRADAGLRESWEDLPSPFEAEGIESAASGYRHRHCPLQEEHLHPCWTRPVGDRRNEVRRYHANFAYQAGKLGRKPRRVDGQGRVASRANLSARRLVTSMARPAERVVAFYNKRGTCEQWIKEGKGAIRWTPAKQQGDLVG